MAVAAVSHLIRNARKFAPEGRGRGDVVSLVAGHRIRHVTAGGKGTLYKSEVTVRGRFEGTGS